MIVEICVGSSCHLKGSQKIVEMFQEAVSQYHLDNDVTLAGSFCTGKCNREGVTVIVDDVVHTGITENNFKEFFEEKIVKGLKEA